MKNLDLRAGYETALSKKSGDNREYFKRCLNLLDIESKKFPGYHVTLHVERGKPSFSYRKRNVQNERMMKRVNRTLARAKDDIQKHRPKNKIIARIDSALEMADSLLYDE